MLTKEQKIEIVRSRVAVIESSIYNIELSILQEESKSQPVQIIMDELNSQRSEELLSLAAVSALLEELLA
jgi:hypothetical protein